MNDVIQVKRCCASCAYKEVTRLMTLRWCTRHRKKVSPHGLCKEWRKRNLFKENVKI